MGLLDGLKKLGLGNLSQKDIYEGEKKAAQEAREKEKKSAEVTEADCLLQKQFECPVCGNKFTQPAVKASKLRMISQDQDLRPRYLNFDPNKYEVVMCNQCGYAVLNRYYGELPSVHKKLLKENIQSSYKPMAEVGETISYEEARLRLELALANAMVRNAHTSEKAMICLRTGWLLRGMKEEVQLKTGFLGKAVETIKQEIANLKQKILETDDAEKEQLMGDLRTKEAALEKLKQMKEKSLNKSQELQAEEEEFLQNSLEGFLNARQKETPPIAGMNETTLDYLLGALCIHFERNDEAYKLLQGIVTSKTAGSAQKDKARNLIEDLREKMHQKKS